MQSVKRYLSRISQLTLLQLYLYFAPLMIYNVSDNLSVPELDSLGLMPVETPIAQSDKTQTTTLQKTIDNSAKK